MKIALISGASSGIGREMTRSLALRFPSLDELWITARREERLKELSREFPGRIRLFPGDLKDGATIKKIREELEEKNARICILVNAAGYGKIGEAGTVSASDARGMIELNCAALTALTEASLPYLGKKSRVINVASAAAFLPQPGFAVYAATKAFVLSYSMALAAELRRKGVFVTAVCPGPVDTEFFSVAEESGRAPFYKKYFMARTERVVSKAIADAFSGKSVSVCGCSMKAFRALAKLLPWSLLLRFYGAGERR